jgi:hypothetical protein
MELVVIIPQGYSDLPEAHRKRIIPICIAAYDSEGKLISPEWFSRGVAPAQQDLIKIARIILGDPWCVSELAEATVHKLWARYGNVLGDNPKRRVLKKAMREAVELNVGDWRKRKHPKLYVALERLDEKVRAHILADPRQRPDLFERQIMLDAFEERLGREGRVQLQRVYGLLRQGHSWEDIALQLGENSPDNLKHRFHRWAKKAGGT